METKPTWRERFDEEFDYATAPALPKEYISIPSPLKERVLSFIETTIAEEREDLAAKVEALKMPTMPDKEIIRSPDGDRLVKEEYKGIITLGYNAALNDMLSALKELN